MFIKHHQPQPLDIIHPQSSPGGDKDHSAGSAVTVPRRMALDQRVDEGVTNGQNAGKMRRIWHQPLVKDGE